MRSVLVLGCLLSFVASSVSAQSPTETTQSLAAAEARIDRLEALVVQLSNLPDSGLKAYVEPPTINANAVAVNGWAGECGSQALGTVEFLVDGVVVPNTSVYRYGRNDVWEVSAGICNGQGTLPWVSGAWGLVDLTNYAVGGHKVAIRIRNVAGLTKTSNEQPFVIVR
jgi:hypothetical protein